jgi:hypothetical protein
MSIYHETACLVAETFGFVPKPCWIAHAREVRGDRMRIASNRIDPAHRKHPCPEDRLPAILWALDKLEGTIPSPGVHSQKIHS